MNFSGDNPTGKHSLLIEFCNAVHQSTDTPSVIRLVADNAEYLRICRLLMSPASSGFEKRFTDLCNEHGFDAVRILNQVRSASRALQLNSAPRYSVDYYQVLGVSPDADQQAIKHAFRVKAKKLHPDKNKSDTEAFLRMNVAYHFLSDEQLRRYYDDKRRTGGKWIEPAKTNRPRSRPKGYGRLLAMIAVVLFVLFAVSFAFDLFYNETSLFDGRQEPWIHADNPDVSTARPGSNAPVVVTEQRPAVVFDPAREDDSAGTPKEPGGTPEAKVMLNAQSGDGQTDGALPGPLPLIRVKDAMKALPGD